MSNRLRLDEINERLHGSSIVLTGDYINMLTVASFKCDKCGREWSQKPMHVLYKKSCRGCYLKSRKQENIITSKIDGVLALDISTKQNPNQSMKIDKFDYIYLKSLGFGKIIARKTYKTYCVCKVNGKMFLVHRIVSGAKKGEMVDHINGDGTDNRRCNLRKCTHSENMRNRALQSNNTSGFVGVKKAANKRSWACKISDGEGNAIHIGTFDTFEKAVRARINAELEIYGEFSPNHNGAS